MGHSTIKALMLTMLLSSCSTFVEDWLSPAISSDLNSAYVKTKPSAKGSKGINAKQKAKEEEKLKQAGKCPRCAGMGKSADGLYTCAACNGTGKYNQTDNKQE